MGKVTNSAVEARRRAKERRIKLYEDRAEKDERIETAAAAFFVAQSEHIRVIDALAAAESQLADSVQLLTDGEGLTNGQVADLLDIDAAEVRRLVKLAADTAAKDSEADAPKPEKGETEKPAGKSGDINTGVKVEQVVGA